MRARLVLALGTALAVGACAAGGPAERAEVSVEAAVEPGTATLGDLVVWTVTARHGAGVEVEIAEPEGPIEGLGLVDLRRGRRRPLFGPRAEELAVTLRAESLGPASLPPLAVTWRPVGDGGTAGAEGGELESPALAVEVLSVLPEGGGVEDIRDLKPLRRVEDVRPWVWLAAAALAVAAAAGLWWWWRRRRADVAVAAPAPPPHEIARAALSALASVDADDPAAVRRFHFAVSEVVRAYVEGRFGLNATDLTTEEIVVRLGGLPELAAGEAERLRGLLRRADGVKFAHDRPGRPEIESIREEALRFVEGTRPVETVETVEREAA